MEKQQSCMVTLTARAASHLRLDQSLIKLSSELTLDDSFN